MVKRWVRPSVVPQIAASQAGGSKAKKVKIPLYFVFLPSAVVLSLFQFHIISSFGCI